jgi:FtsP/CotA-like multicopper oxidase with cupredoxin domain
MNYINFNAKSPTSIQHPQVIHRRMRNAGPMLLILLVLALFFSLFGQNTFAQSASVGKLHTIELWADKIPAGAEGGNDRFAYQMNSHVIADMDGSNETDVTSRYAMAPTVPGPTIVINEGDEVALTLSHVFDPGDSTTLDQVSVHVHGVHYDILSDGTIQYINLVEDESATPVASYTYRWIAAPGTAGTWAYHDHNMITLNGAEDRGLYGALIVNSSASLDSIAKDYVLFIGDDAFFGMEIDSQTGQQVALGDNPTLTAQQGSNVRFHLVALGTVTHNFALPGYSWTDPGTNLTIDNKIVGPLEKHVFTVLADSNSQYMDTVFSSSLLGMKGDFNVIP